MDDEIKVTTDITNEIESGENETVNDDVDESAKFAMYSGKIPAFKNTVKHIKANIIKSYKDAGTLNTLASEYSKTIKKGMSTFPMKCSAACEIIDVCPFNEVGNIPEGDPCPIELYMIDELSTSLQAEVTGGHRKCTISEMLTISSIVSLTVIANFRLNAIISMDSLKKQVAIKGPNGMVETISLNPLIESMYKLYSETQSLLKNLHLNKLDKSRYPDKQEQPKDQKDNGLDMQKFTKYLAEKGIDSKILTEAIKHSAEKE